MLHLNWHPRLDHVMLSPKSFIRSPIHATIVKLTQPQGKRRSSANSLLSRGPSVIAPSYLLGGELVHRCQVNLKLTAIYLVLYMYDIAVGNH